MFQNINSSNCILRMMGTTMDDEAGEFLANAEGGIVPVSCHDNVLRIAYIYIDPFTRVVTNYWHTLLVDIVDHSVAPTVSSAAKSSRA